MEIKYKSPMFHSYVCLPEGTMESKKAITVHNQYIYSSLYIYTQSFDVTSYSLLVGGFKHEFYFPFHIWDVILPIDELIFSRWLLHHQPEKLWKITIFDG